MTGAVLEDPPQSVTIAGRKYTAAADHGVAVLLTAAGWILQRLPGQVIEEHRGELIRTLGQARNLIIEITCTPTAMVRVKDGKRLLVEIPADGRQEGRTRAYSIGSRRRASTGLQTRFREGCRSLLISVNLRPCSAFFFPSLGEWMRRSRGSDPPPH